MSEIRANTVSNAAGTGPVTLTGQSAAKAWGGITYSSGTPSVQQSGNVSSLTDVGVGRLLVYFTNNMSAANYGGATACSPSTNNDASVNMDQRFVNYYSVQFYENATSPTDPNYYGFSTHGDLA